MFQYYGSLFSKLHQNIKIICFKNRNAIKKDATNTCLLLLYQYKVFSRAKCFQLTHKMYLQNVSFKSLFHVNFSVISSRGHSKSMYAQILQFLTHLLAFLVRFPFPYLVRFIYIFHPPFYTHTYKLMKLMKS